jgi:asparagine synthase (glutamine-hydrolysing)
MCGIALLYGPSASTRIDSMMTRLQHRGPDDVGFWKSDRIAIGFSRLAINDITEAGKQPYFCDGYVGAFNGEVYNHTSLASKFRMELNSQCDTHIILPLYLLEHEKILCDLDGFYSGLIYHPATNKLLLIRDHIGKKPLFIGESEGDFFVVSELKAIDRICWFKEVPCGISQVDLQTRSFTLISEHSKEIKPKDQLESTLFEAVNKRIPALDQKFGVFLSGGLDSSIISALTCRLRSDAIYFTLGNQNSTDSLMVQKLCKHLELSNLRSIPLPSTEELPDLIQSVVYATESYNPSIISNGLATYILSAAAKKEHIKVVLTGEGADEMFAGYHYDLSPSQWQDTQAKLIQDMHFTELRRLDLCSMAHGIESRCPFLDKDIRSIAENLDFADYFAQGINKVLLRSTFGHLLPKDIAERRKTSFDVGSGIRAMVVNYLQRNGKSEKEELHEIWCNVFQHDTSDPYFHSYPAFDKVISQRGGDHR